jgi:hypothetical protein
MEVAMKINGEIALDDLSNELGLESDRVRRLATEAITDEISIFWTESGLPALPDENYISLANASLASGAVGEKKLNELIYKYSEKLPAKTTHAEILGKIQIIAGKHQSIINLSRNRGVYINAHLNLLEPERTLKRVYAPYLNENELKKYQQRSRSILNTGINSEADFRKWIIGVHELLNDICESASKSSTNEAGVKGVISKKSMSTYLKQWEVFALEKMGYKFDISLKELSPLSERLKELEKSKKRSWSTIAREITEAEKSGELQRKIESTVQRTSNNRLISSNLLTRNLTLSDKRPVTLEISKDGVNRELIEQFIDGFLAQLAIYDGKGIFESSINYQGSVINISLPKASKSDVAQIEKYLLLLIR